MLTVSPEPLLPVRSQAGLDLPNGRSFLAATKIAYSAQKDQPPVTISISRAHVIKLELENYILRTHVTDFERTIFKRVNDALEEVVRDGGAGGILDDLQQKAREKEQAETEARARHGVVGDTNYISPFPPVKKSFIVVLKVPSKSLALLENRKNAGKRVRVGESAAGAKVKEHVCMPSRQRSWFPSYAEQSGK